MGKTIKTINAFSLPELLVVLVIIGILVLVALPNLMPLISRAKATEAQQQLTFLHSLEQSYFYAYSRYSDDLSELGFEQAQLVTEGGNANYRIEVISADLAKDTSFLPYAYRQTERFTATTIIFCKQAPFQQYPQTVSEDRKSHLVRQTDLNTILLAM